MKYAGFVGLMALFFCGAFFVAAQEIHQDLEEVLKAEVVEIVREEERMVPGTDTPTTVQTIRARVTEGAREGEVIEFENDFIVLTEGQRFYLNHLAFIDGGEMYMVRDVDRTRGIIALLCLFAGAVVLLGGMQGVRSLLSLIVSFAVIVWALFPLLLAGYSPIAVSIVLGSLILALALFLTHGVSLRSLAAWLGASLSIVITGLVAYFGTELLSLSGFFSDETVYLNLNTNGLLDFKGLLLGGIIIGVLGVLDDIAVTQVAVVAELHATDPTLTPQELFARALRVGREHVSALVNTIVLAYAGVALPLLLFFAHTQSSLLDVLNNEIFATEIVRTIAGSIGLIATVPIATALAVFFAQRTNLVSPGEKAHTHHHA